MIFVGGNL